MKIEKAAQKEETRERMRGGEGSVLIRHLLAGDALPPGCRLYARITLQPGCSIGEHMHEGEAEVFHILSGHAEMLESGQSVRMEPGDTCITRNASHSIRCAGDKPVEFMATIMLG